MGVLRVNKVDLITAEVIGKGRSEELRNPVLGDAIDLPVRRVPRFGLRTRRRLLPRGSAAVRFVLDVAPDVAAPLGVGIKELHHLHEREVLRLVVLGVGVVDAFRSPWDTLC